MLEVRFHGRGGQGAVVAGKILATAMFREGHFVQAFPTFGVERRGAPVMAFVRADKKKINLRHQIYNPDHIVVLDPTLLALPSIFDGLKEGGLVLINADVDEGTLRKNSRLRDRTIAVVDAACIAVTHRLGTKTAPIVNTAILGAFAKVVPVVGIGSICSAIREGVPVKSEENVAAAREAYESVCIYKI